MPPNSHARHTSPNHSLSSEQRRSHNYASDPNLPEEVKKYLITAEKLVTTGKGSLADSRWAPTQDKIKAGIIKVDSQELNSPSSSTITSESNRLVQLPPKGLKAAARASPSLFNRQPTTHVASASQLTHNQDPGDSAEKFLARLAAKNITFSHPNATARGRELEEAKQNGSVIFDRNTTSPSCPYPKAEAFAPSPTQSYAVLPHLRVAGQKAPIIPQESVVSKDSVPELTSIMPDSVDHQGIEQTTESTPQEDQSQTLPQQPTFLKDTERMLRPTQQESTTLPHSRGPKHTTQSTLQKLIIQRNSELKSEYIHQTPATLPHLRVAEHITQDSTTVKDTKPKLRGMLSVSVPPLISSIMGGGTQQSSILRYFKIVEQRSQTPPLRSVVHRDTAQNIQTSYHDPMPLSDLTDADQDPSPTSQKPDALSIGDQKSKSTPDRDSQNLQDSKKNNQAHSSTNEVAIASVTMITSESNQQYLPPHLRGAEAKIAPHTKTNLTTLENARDTTAHKASKVESTIPPHLRGVVSKPQPNHKATTAMSLHMHLPQTGHVMMAHTSLKPDGYNIPHFTGAELKIPPKVKDESTSMSHAHKVKVENTPLHSVGIHSYTRPITRASNLPPNLHGTKVEGIHPHSVAKANNFTPSIQTNSLPPHLGLKVEGIAPNNSAQSGDQTHPKNTITATRKNRQCPNIGFSTPQKQKSREFDTPNSVSSNNKSTATSGGVSLRAIPASLVQNLPPHLRYPTPQTLEQETTSSSPNYIAIKKGAVTLPESESITNPLNTTLKTNTQRSPVALPTEIASGTPSAKMQSRALTFPTAESKAEINPDEWLNKAAAVRKARQQAQNITANPRANAFATPLIWLSKSSDNAFQTLSDRKKNTPTANTTIYTLKGRAQKQKLAQDVVASPVELPDPNSDTKIDKVPSKIIVNENETRKVKMPYEDNFPITKTGTATAATKPLGKENDNPIIQNIPSPSVKSTEPTLKISCVKALAEKESSTAAVGSSNGWASPQAQDTNNFLHMILKDIEAVQTIATKGHELTEDALAKASGFILHTHSNSFEAGISDAGVGERPEEPKDSILWKQGKPAKEELLDWDGSWLPPPCDWDDRGIHDKSYMPSLIQEWQKNQEIPCGPGFELDTNLLHYKNGHPPCNGFFSKTDESPVCIPDIENSEDEQKRLEQTSKSSSERFVKNQQNNRRLAKEMAIVHEAYNEEVLTLEPEIDLYPPKIDIYLRPVSDEDANGIAMIYNHHVTTTFIPEDQTPITEDDVEFMIENAKKERLPFIVAIRGQAPKFQDALGRRTSSKKAAMPKCEMVIGFATAEIYNYGLGGSRTGRSRTTANLMLYVHPEYKRKGVGRNLLDRLVHNMSPGYGYRKACSWLNPENDTVHESGGPGHFHQIIFQLPVLPKDDPNLPWIKNFLYNGYFFTEEARLKSMGRSRATPCPAKWLDVIVFQGQVYQAEEFDPHDYCLIAGVQRSA